MKSIVKTLTIAAVLLTALPAQAMFSRLRTTFASIHNGRKVLTAIGAAMGLGSTAYAVQQARKQQAKPERHFDCLHDIARTTFNALRSENDPTAYEAWMNERTHVFNYCKRSMPQSTREQLYNVNIAYAKAQALNCGWYANQLAEEKNPDSYDLGYLNHIRKVSNLYAQTAQKLRRDFRQEQEANRKREQQIKELEMLTWLHFA
ncbi:MAG: hypothetical protein ACHQVS_01675 [Candidatus Babeliales bacterium]